MGKLDGRVVIVTGAARGQGEQEARLFAAEGAEVVVADVLDEQGGALAEELGARYVHLDVRHEDQWQSAVNTVKDAHGRIDGLVNNAGILRFNSLLDTPLDEFMQVVQVNQVGCFLGIKTVAPVMEDGGTIVNTASYTAVTGMAAVGSYAATKHATLGLTRVAALELADRRIRVNAMCPGAIDTAMSNPLRRGAGTPLLRHSRYTVHRRSPQTSRATPSVCLVHGRCVSCGERAHSQTRWISQGPHLVFAHFRTDPSNKIPPTA